VRRRFITSRSRITPPKTTEAAAIFAALSDETRLVIVARLCKDGPLSIVRLTDGSTISRQAITKHLNTLSKAGLVRSERTGRERIWKLRTKRLAEVSRYLTQISEQWDEALDQLRTFMEQE
jgi:DNA-binding transcriptional ArsR family regulator